MSTNFCNEFLGAVLKCKDYSHCERLNTIYVDGSVIYEACKADADLSFDNVLKVVHKLALEYLTTFYRNACDAFDAGNYGIYGADEVELLRECLDFVSPHDDLHIGSDSDGVYLELDYWDIYANVIEELCTDKQFSFRQFLDEFTVNVYGGKNYPEKFDSLL